MSRIEELIAEHCPDGVEFLKLGGVTRIKTGSSVSKIAINKNPGDYPVINSGRDPLGFINSYNTENDPIGLTSRGAGVGSVTWCEGRYFRGNLNYSVSIIDDSLIDTRFLFHQLLYLQPKIQELCTYQGIPALNKSNLEKLAIPVPPLPVQREIARILDQFTQLEAELEAELEARRSQRAFYRSSLLTWNNGAESYPLGELADFRYGFTAKAAASGDYRFLRITDITPWGKLSPEGSKYVTSTDAVREYVVAPGDLLMARTGATYGKTMLVDSVEPAVYASFLIRIRFKQPNLLPAYYWHFAQSDLYWSQANAMVSTGGQPQFNANVLKQVQVPVPSVDEQERIVEVLDKFDALVNDLNIGLPAELAARRKQYEHYRDRLLTFEEDTA